MNFYEIVRFIRVYLPDKNLTRLLVMERKRITEKEPSVTRREKQGRVENPRVPIYGRDPPRVGPQVSVQTCVFSLYVFYQPTPSSHPDRLTTQSFVPFEESSPLSARRSLLHCRPGVVGSSSNDFWPRDRVVLLNTSHTFRSDLPFHPEG